MILTGKQINAEVEKGNIQIEPYNEELLNPNSYNYRLSDVLYKVTDDIINPKQKTSFERIVIPKSGYCLQPKNLYLGSTLEMIGSPKYSMQLIGRSSIGRLGLFLQITAPLGHIGSYHCWTLELKVVQPLVVYPNMKIGQVSFWAVYGSNDLPYDSKYWKYKKPHISEFYKELQ